jgi:acyl dehydratase
MEQVPIADSCVARQYSKEPGWLRLCVFVVHTAETESTTKTQRAKRSGEETMNQHLVENLDDLKALVGQEVALTDYRPISQERVNQFADTTEDRQWIHVDVDRAKRESPYHNTIAHGFLTLALLSSFLSQSLSFKRPPMGVNYGLDRVRFPAPVPVGSRVRARIRLLAAEEVQGGLQAKWSITVECEGAEKPSCVAEWIVRYYA